MLYLSTLDEVTEDAVCQIKVQQKRSHIILINYIIKVFIANLTPNEV